MYLVIALNATGIGFESLPIQRDGRVAPVPMTPPNDAEGAPGPSPLGTGDVTTFRGTRSAPSGAGFVSPAFQRGEPFPITARNPVGAASTSTKDVPRVRIDSAMAE